MSRSLHVGFVVDETVSGFLFLGVLHFIPVTNFIPPLLHTHLMLSLHFPVMVRQAWSARILVIHRPLVKGLHRILFLNPTLCRTRLEDIFKVYGIITLLAIS